MMVRPSVPPGMTRIHQIVLTCPLVTTIFSIALHEHRGSATLLGARRVGVVLDGSKSKSNYVKQLSSLGGHPKPQRSLAAAPQPVLRSPFHGRYTPRIA